MKRAVVAGWALLAGGVVGVLPVRGDVLLTAPLSAATGYGYQISGAYGIPCQFCSNGFGTNATLAESFLAPVGAPSLQNFTFFLQANDFSTNLKLTAFVIPWLGPDMYPSGSTGPLGTAGGSVGGPAGSPIFVSNTINFSANSQTVSGFQPVEVVTGGLNLTPGKAYVIGLTTDDPNSPNPGQAYPAGPDNFTSSQGFAVAALVNSHPSGAGDGGVTQPVAAYGPGGVCCVANLGGVGDFYDLSHAAYWNNQFDAADNKYINPGRDFGDLAYAADFESTFTLTGTISPAVESLDYRELIYQLSNGVTTIDGTMALSGGCAVLSSCPFSDTLAFSAPAGFIPTSVKYTIMGFYGGGPQAGDVDCSSGTCVVTQNPDVFALTNGTFSGDFDAFWNPQPPNPACTGPVQPVFCLAAPTGAELDVASQFYNGNLIDAESVQAGAWANFASSLLGGSSTAHVKDFSAGVDNGNAILQTDTSNEGPLPQGTPEPAGLSALGLLLLLAAGWKRGRR